MSSKLEPVIWLRDTGHIGIYGGAGQVSKTTELAHLFPAINVSKWRTTNEISPRTLTSHQAARTFVQILIIG